MVSVGRILEGAFGLIREHVAAVAIWAAVYLVMNVALLLLMQPLFQAVADGTGAVPVGADSSFADRMGMMNFILPIYGMNLLMALVGLVLYAAAMRAVLRPEASGFGYLRIGGDELRLFALLLIFGLAGMLLMIAWGIAFALLSAGAAAGTESIGITITIVFGSMFVLFVVAAFFLIRVSLAFPLTLYRRRIVIGEAWRMSRGHFWTLFGAALVVTLIGGLMMTVAGIFTTGSYFAELAGASGDAAAVNRAAQAQMARAGTISATTIIQALAGAAIGAIWIALSGGSAATAAKLMLAQEFDDPETVFG